MAKPIETPRFLFERHHDVEVTHGWSLAGVITVDIPKEPMPRARRHRRTIDAIVGQLILAAQLGAMPADGAMLYGEWPSSSIDTDDNDAMADWVARSLVVMLRVIARPDGTLRVEIQVPNDDDYGPGPGRATVH